MMARSTKKLGEMKMAWLVRWGCHSQDEDECLRRSEIKQKIVDVISVRKDFDKHIVEIARDIYKQKMLSFSEKVSLSNYSKGEKHRKEFFGGAVPVFTHYQSDVYRNLLTPTQLPPPKNKPDFLSAPRNICGEFCIRLMLFRARRRRPLSPVGQKFAISFVFDAAQIYSWGLSSGA